MTSRKFARVAGRATALTAAMATAAALAQGSAAGAAITTGTAAHAAAAAGGFIPGGPTAVFTVSGPCQNSYIVPADRSELHVVLVGGRGASGSGPMLESGSAGGGGGDGAQVVADLRVKPGEQLNVDVGANGSDPTTAEGQQTVYVGGAVGGIEHSGAQSFGGQGGGASVIDDQGAGCGNPGSGDVLAVAAGGGGGGGAGAVYDGGGGGTAGEDINGNPKKMNGANGNGIFVGGGGGGAFGSIGGYGGGSVGSTTGQPGGPISGGSGGARTLPANQNVYDGGGGGGGGWYGGGGGGEGGGGGGGGGGAGSSAVFGRSGSRVDSIAPTSASTMVSIQPVISPPDPPPVVSAVAGNQQATLSFSPPAHDGGAPIEFYTVYTSTKNGRFGRPLTTSGSPITVRNLTPGQSYAFTVTATNVAGEGFGSPSNVVVPYRIPGPPKITSATAGNGQATVAFTPSQADQNLGNPITSYTVTVRQGVNVTSGPAITTASGATSPITVTGLTNGTNYTVTVHATNKAGDGPESAPAVVFPQTVPGAPANVTAANATPVGATTGTVNVAFTPPADDGGRPVLNYTAVSSPGGITATAGAGAPGIPVTGLTIGTSYTFTVYATNAVGDGPASDPSNAVTPTPVGMPSPPQNPGAAPLDQAAYVSCLPPTSDGGSAITSYTVTSSPGNITATGPSCPILVTGLTDGTKYTFTVTATNADGGTSQPSQPTSTVTPHVPSGKPPKNDTFASAQPISGTSGSVSGTNVGATMEPGEPTIQDNRGGASVWYKWVVPATGTYQFDTCSANPGVVGLIGLFTGNSVSSAAEIPPGPGSDLCPAGEAGSTIIAGPMSAGLVLYIKFDGINPGSNANPPYQGPFTLEWKQT